MSFLAHFSIPAQYRNASGRNDPPFAGEELAKQVAVDRRLVFGFEFLSGIRHFEGPSPIRLKIPLTTRTCTSDEVPHVLHPGLG